MAGSLNLVLNPAWFDEIENGVDNPDSWPAIWNTLLQNEMHSLIWRGHMAVSSNHCDYEMFCFKGEMNAPKRLKDSKAWLFNKLFAWTTILLMWMQN